MADYLYDKENPRSPLRNKPQGWDSFYNGTPNHFERTEMITRRMLKDYDGDLAKVSLELKKHIDLGGKWRTLKNHAKFLKNPIGHVIWRLKYAANQNRAPNVWNMFVLANCFATFILLTIRSKRKSL